MTSEKTTRCAGFEHHKASYVAIHTGQDRFDVVERRCEHNGDVVEFRITSFRAKKGPETKTKTLVSRARAALGDLPSVRFLTGDHVRYGAAHAVVVERLPEQRYLVELPDPERLFVPGAPKRRIPVAAKFLRPESPVYFA